MDMERSGATIARDHFQLGPDLGPELSSLFDLVEDNDLWRHKLPDSKLFSAGFKDLGLELDVNQNLGLFEVLSGLKADAVVERGREAIRETNRVVAKEAAMAAMVKVVRSAAWRSKPSTRTAGAPSGTRWPSSRPPLGSRRSGSSSSSSPGWVRPRARATTRFRSGHRWLRRLCLGQRVGRRRPRSRSVV